MALRIRLRRMGRKKAPHYRIVVAESSMPRDGRFVTSVGHYNPRTEPVTLVVDRAQAREWIARGATPTDTVASLLKRAGVYRDEPEGAESVVAGVTGAASRAAAAVGGAVSGAAGAIRDAAAAVAETVQEAASDIADRARDAVVSDASGDATAADEGAGHVAAADAGDGADQAAAEDEPAQA